MYFKFVLIQHILSTQVSDTGPVVLWFILIPVKTDVIKEVEPLPDLDVPLADPDPVVPTVVPNYTKPGRNL